MKQIACRIIFFAMFVFSKFGFAGLLIDTGTPTIEFGAVGNSLFGKPSDSTGQSIAGQFELFDEETVRGIQGNFDDRLFFSGGTLTAVIYGDAGNIPDITSEIFSDVFEVPAISGPRPFEEQWYGLSLIDITLLSGKYWLAFEVRDTNTYSGFMRGGVPNPLFYEALNDGGTLPYRSSGPTRHESSQLGYRIFVNEVPNPATIWLFGSCLIGMISLRKKQC